MEDEALTPGALRVIAGKVSGDEVVEFAFNPTEYTIAKSAQWTRAQMKGGKKTGKPEFNGANPQTLQMEVFLDASVGGPEKVASRVATLIGWVNPTEESVKKKKPQPPILAFEWGDNPALTDFQAYLKTVTAKYVLFAPGGTPLRATANVTLEEVPPEAKKQNPTSGAIHGRRSHLLLEGESLAGLAWAEYEDAGLWRGLAAFNEIDDPFRVRPGTSLLLPTADEARRLS
jgi:hypothetical protein